MNILESLVQALLVVVLIGRLAIWGGLLLVAVVLWRRASATVMPWIAISIALRLLFNRIIHLTVPSMLPHPMSIEAITAPTVINYVLLWIYLIGTAMNIITALMLCGWIADVVSFIPSLIGSRFLTNLRRVNRSVPTLGLTLLGLSLIYPIPALILYIF